MINLRSFFSLLMLLSLIACDDKAAKPKSTAQDFPQTVKTLPEFNNFQTSSYIEQLKAQLLNNPNDFNMLSALADMYFESSQYFEAIQTYDRAIAVNPACADCFNDKGLALYYLGDANAAIESFDKAIEIDPTYTNAWLSKGYVLVSVGRYQEAIEPLNKVKELDTTGDLAPEADKFLATAMKMGVQ